MTNEEKYREEAIVLGKALYGKEFYISRCDDKFIKAYLAAKQSSEKEIEALRLELADARGVIEFYGDEAHVVDQVIRGNESSWVDGTKWSEEMRWEMGKRAREFLAGWLLK